MKDFLFLVMKTSNIEKKIVILIDSCNIDSSGSNKTTLDPRNLRIDIIFLA